MDIQKFNPASLFSSLRSSTGARAWEIDEVALEIEDHVRELLVHRTMEAGSGDANRGSRRRTRRSSKRMHGSTRRMCASFRRMQGSSRRDAHGLAEDVAGDSSDARRELPTAGYDKTQATAENGLTEQGRLRRGDDHPRKLYRRAVAADEDGPRWPN
ncbi:hypothetical protein TRIUR3_01181 [Triticum urartu]|uniref:Uncharacterized protein n=1 Tax=Triticum urartu TaxID=4572 RepID=M7ZVZ0_TRIUA|nr:hypothetical protein TRIUR3_01181 [Triticum urartu]